MDEIAQNTEVSQDVTENTVPEIPGWRKIAEQAETLHKDLPKKRVAIVGFAPTRDQAPYYDQSIEIWGLNDLHQHIPRYNRWFDIHTLENIDTDVVEGRTSAAVRKVQINEVLIENMGISGLSKLTVPVYMQDKYPQVPWSIKFPLAEMLAFFEAKGYTGARYLTNSISYMIAYALFEGAVVGHQWDEIQIWGVDMAVGDEYIAQRPSCEYWIGVAEGMGVKVYIPNASDLCKTSFLYGFQSNAQKVYEGKLDKIRTDAEQRLMSLRQQQAELGRLINHAEAHVGVISDMKRIWSNLDTKIS